MDWVGVISVSISMSVDAMTVNATNGLKEENIKKIKIILIALSFGIFQFVMPTIGYFISSTFSSYLKATKIAIPIIAFVLLFLLAVNSFVDWLKDFRKSRKEKNNEEDLNGAEYVKDEMQVSSKLSIWNILIQDIATSIDALCIGFAYMSLSVKDAMIFFTIIGCTTFLLSMITGLCGKVLSKYLEKYASLIAALVFLAVGLKILIEGLI